MITVWGRRNSLNVQKVMWTLGELGLAYERLDVAGSFGFPDDYATLNPNRVVPTIGDGDLTLWESNVCVRYLCRKYGKGTLWPDDVGALALADQWMDWQTSTLGQAFFHIFLNKIRLPADKADAAQIEAGIANCARLFGHLDEQLADRQFVAGDAFTLGDIPLGVMSHRYLTLDIERPQIPHVVDWYRRLSERPAYQNHVMIPFGRNSEEWLVEEKRGAGVQ